MRAMDTASFPPDAAQDRARSRFAELIGDPDSQPPLVETALVIALEEYPEMSVRNYLARLHAFTSVVADRVRDAALGHPDGEVPVDERLGILNHYVFADLGFRGNREAYYDPRNSFLNEVIDRRLGIPITLSLIYMELAKGAGLRLAGVGFPGHFLVKTQGVRPARMIDPFNGGVELGPGEMETLLRELRVRGLEVLEALRALDNRSIVRRLLWNLKEIYLREGDVARALRVVERLLLVSPDEPRELFERGLLCGQLGRYREGIEALERYLGAAPEGADRETAEKQLARLRFWRSKIN